MTTENINDYCDRSEGIDGNTLPHLPPKLQNLPHCCSSQESAMSERPSANGAKGNATDPEQSPASSDIVRGLPEMSVAEALEYVDGTTVGELTSDKGWSVVDDERALRALAGEVRRLCPAFSLQVHADECSTVDEALTRADVAHRAGWTRPNQAEVVLAAEVRRLREQLAKREAVWAEDGIEMRRLREENARYKRAEDDRTQLAEGAMKLRAKLERVEALPTEWRDHAEQRAGRHGEYGNGAEARAKKCALDLEAALRGEP